MPEKVIEVDVPVPSLRVVEHLCKGCGLCVEHCPQNCIELGEKFNELGYKAASYKGDGCTGCGICFYCCPEPGAIIVYKKSREK